MAEIRIERNHQLGKREAHRRLAEIEPKLKEKYGVELTWAGDHAQVKGTGVSGQLSLGEERLALDLKIGLLLRPMAGKIRTALERQIDQALA